MSEQNYKLEPICPRCGATQRDAWKIDFDDDEGATIVCRSCKKSMFIKRHISVTYSTNTRPFDNIRGEK